MYFLIFICYIYSTSAQESIICVVYSTVVNLTELILFSKPLNFR